MPQKTGPSISKDPHSVQQVSLADNDEATKTPKETEAKDITKGETGV